MPGSGDRTVLNLLTSLASDRISPGSGTAAAAAMAFAAACAGKALAVSRKHRPADVRTTAAEGRLNDIVRRSLERADADSTCFEEFIHRKDPHTARALISADEETQALARELAVLLHEIEPVVHPIMAGDALAARALLEAANRIQLRIGAENRRAAAQWL